MIQGLILQLKDLLQWTVLSNPVLGREGRDRTSSRSLAAHPLNAVIHPAAVDSVFGSFPGLKGLAKGSVAGDSGGAAPIHEHFTMV